MHLKYRFIAILTLISILLIHSRYASIASPNRYTPVVSNLKIISCHEDSSSYFLLLKFNSKQILGTPKIQFLKDENTHTIMLADFSGVIFRNEPRIFHPKNIQDSGINSIRYGQFQSNPAIFRISIDSKKENILENLEFICHSGQLILRKQNKLAKKIISTSADLENKKKNDQLEGTKLVTQKENYLSSQNTIKKKNKVPFTVGGLYLELASYSTDELPPLAPNFIKQNIPEASLPIAPEFRKANRNNSANLYTKNTETTTNSIKDNINESCLITKKPQESLEQTASAANAQIELINEKIPKIKIKIDGKASIKTFDLEDPPRYAIDIADLPLKFTNCPLLPSDLISTNKSWLKSIRIGNPEPGISRIVLDLYCLPSEISMNCEKTDISTNLFIQTTEISAEKNKSEKISSPKLVVLDPGHGGSDPGAQRGEIQEKEITLSIVEKLKSFLIDQGLKVILTREDDSFVSLEDRVKLTNQNAPDAFVSVHINSLETDSDIAGIETYFQTDRSRTLAEQVHNKLLKELSVPDRFVRKARFYVINHTDNPSILAEVGFISNKSERTKLISSSYQDKIAKAIGEGVILFLSKDKVKQNIENELVESTPKVNLKKFASSQSNLQSQPN